MVTAKRTGLYLIAFAVSATTVAGLKSSAPDTSSQHVKSYAIAVSGWGSMRLIELGTDWPTKALAASDRLMFCRHVVRMAGVEIGTSCAVEATTIADASQ